MTGTVRNKKQVLTVELKNRERSLTTQLNPRRERSLTTQLNPRTVRDYNDLRNKPQIEGVELKGNKNFEELGITSVTNAELAEILT